MLFPWMHTNRHGYITTHSHTRLHDTPVTQWIFMVLETSDMHSEDLINTHMTSKHMTHTHDTPTHMTHTHDTHTHTSHKTHTTYHTIHIIHISQIYHINNINHPLLAMVIIRCQS